MLSDALKTIYIFSLFSSFFFSCLPLSFTKTMSLRRSNRDLFFLSIDLVLWLDISTYLSLSFSLFSFSFGNQNTTLFQLIFILSKRNIAFGSFFFFLLITFIEIQSSNTLDFHTEATIVLLICRLIHRIRIERHDDDDGCLSTN